MAELIADPFRAARLLLTLRRAGVTDSGVLAAMENLPRDAFVSEDYADMAFEDCVLPIACGQIIPRPSVIGGLLQLLELGKQTKSRVLLIGLGSGYTAGLLSDLAQDVFAIERYRELYESASTTLAGLEIKNVRTKNADGLGGWPERGPFDRILLMGAVTEMPDILRQQLTPGGFLIAPVINGDAQEIMRFDSNDETGRALGPISLTRLTEGSARAL